MEEVFRSLTKVKVGIRQCKKSAKSTYHVKSKCSAASRPQSVIYHYILLVLLLMDEPISSILMLLLVKKDLII